nr:transposase [Lachnospiraceae bacterium]
MQISDNDMLSFDGVLKGIDAHVVYKKQQIKGGRFLYAFKDARKASKEEATYLANAKKKNTFSPEQYAKKKDLFGVIVLESDQDLEPKAACTCYEDRWLLELVFKNKSDECLDHTGAQGDFSVIGSEFINFISTVATCR